MRMLIQRRECHVCGGRGSIHGTSCAWCYGSGLEVIDAKESKLRISQWAAAQGAANSVTQTTDERPIVEYPVPEGFWPGFAVGVLCCGLWAGILWEVVKLWKAWH